MQQLPQKAVERGGSSARKVGFSCSQSDSHTSRTSQSGEHRHRVRLTLTELPKSQDRIIKFVWWREPRGVCFSSSSSTPSGMKQIWSRLPMGGEASSNERGPQPASSASAN
ncbi:hypothetical protein N7539_005393 [Penicillium diatomitis]|uniref:Uncharacterized protein n=1 Tax=Penicillium diatomitis TaxID=2819901 RepID=A0A9W9X6S9_9EURO|nr:uncharacterized protein N7539_005393 [Penicillium diatomitis]KAJ5485405.1 hypothetical protein N7539_005393 [Penicillium diatomitis]